MTRSSVPATRLRSFAGAVLRTTGMSAEDAEITADALVWADLRGLDAHGVWHKLPQCVARVRAGGTRGDAVPVVVHESPGVRVLDGADAWGQVAVTRAMRTAADLARDGGIGTAVVRNVSSAAAIGYYPMIAVEQRMIGIAVSNGPPLMAPWGGTTRLLGNFGHSIGVPAARHFPLLFDSSLSLMSTGEMDLLHERGELLPADVLLDERGEPTRDPAAWFTGMLLPAGGHRGFGLAMMFEILTGVLAGGRFAPDIGSPKALGDPQGVSVTVICIDPATVLPYEEFVERVDRLIDAVHSSPPARGVDRVLVPGERGFLAADRRERDGIPLSPQRDQQLRALGEEVGVPW